MLWILDCDGGTPTALSESDVGIVIRGLYISIFLSQNSYDNFLIFFKLGKKISHCEMCMFSQIPLKSTQINQSEIYVIFPLDLRVQ